MVALKLADYATLMRVIFKPAYEDVYEKSELEVELAGILNLQTISLINLNTSLITLKEYQEKAERAKNELKDTKFSFKRKWHSISSIEDWYMSKLTSQENQRFTRFFDKIICHKLTRMYERSGTAGFRKRTMFSYGDELFED